MYQISFIYLVEFSAGILRGIFFNNKRQHYMNYGGRVIGPEIIHDFDDVGSQYNFIYIYISLNTWHQATIVSPDKEGKFVGWWKPETKKRYLKRAKCIINMEIISQKKSLNLDGLNTLRKNIADNGGIKKAYYAYKEWVKRNKPEQRLPGLLYSLEQMFWISVANSWCTKDRLKALKHW